jgi:hypothetical protein
MKKIIFYTAILVLVGLAASPAWAESGWAEPTVKAPGGNVEAPINVSDQGQTKGGGLVINGLLRAINGFVAGILADGENPLPNGLLARVKGNLGATKYCDSNGLYCKEIKDIGGGYWTANGNNIYNNNIGNVGVGTGATAPEGKLSVSGDVGIGALTNTDQQNHMLDIVSVKGVPNQSAIRATYTPGTSSLTGTEFGALANRDANWSALYAKQGAASAAGYFVGKVGINLANPQYSLAVQDGANGPTGYFKNTNGAGGYAAAVVGESVNSGLAAGAIGYLGGFDTERGLWYGVKGESAYLGHAAVLGKASVGAYAGYFYGGSVAIRRAYDSDPFTLHQSTTGNLIVSRDVCISASSPVGANKCLSGVNTTTPPPAVGALSCVEVATNPIVRSDNPAYPPGTNNLLATVSCPSGYTLTGGGFVTNGPACGVYESARYDANTWKAKCKLLDGASIGANPLTIAATATCCKVQ